MFIQPETNPSVSKLMVKGAALGFVLGMLVFGLFIVTSLGYVSSLLLFQSIPFFCLILGALLGLLVAKKKYSLIVILIILIFACAIGFANPLGKYINYNLSPHSN